MSDESVKVLGKVSGIRMGYGGYQDCMIGLSLTFEGKSDVMGDWAVGDFIGFWAQSLYFSEDNYSWTEQDRSNQFAKVVNKIDEMLYATGKSDLKDLVGTPVEVTFAHAAGSPKMLEWRVLTEVL